MSKLLCLSAPASDKCEPAQQSSAKPNTVTRNVLVTISGNRTTWQGLNMHGAIWRVNPERASAIFCPELSVAGDLNDRLSRALIKKVTVLESNTNIDEVVGISIDGLPPKEFTANGDGAALFLTGEGRVTDPQEIFNMSGDTDLGLQWMQQFPNHTADNLVDVGTMYLPGATYYFVSEDHPVLHLLKTNEMHFGSQIQCEEMMDGNWYKIDIEIFQWCVKTIRETVLHTAPSTFNLNTLTVRLAKPDGQQWLHFSPQYIDSLVPPDVRNTDDPQTIQIARLKAVDRYVDKPLYVTLRLSFEYALPDIPKQPVAVVRAG